MSVRILNVNKIKTVQRLFTASSEDEDYPANNLQTDNYSQTWRTEDVATAYTVVQDFGAATECDTCFLGNVNLTSSATVKIQANASDSWGAPSVDETITVSGLGLSPPHRNLYHELASAETYRYWRISISDTGNTNGFYEVGEWWLGSRTTLDATQQPEVEHREIYDRNNIEHVTEYLQKYVYSRADRRTFVLNFNKITKTTMNTLRALERAQDGSGLPFVFVLDTSATPYEGFFVRIAGDVTVEQSAPTYYDIPLTLEEEAAGQSLPAVE